MSYVRGSIKVYLKDLAARQPAPGGGAAAAFSAATAASLVMMVSRYSIGKAKNQKTEKAIKKILTEAGRFHKRLSMLIDKDIRAYQSRKGHDFIKVPAEVCLLSYRLARCGAELLKKGNHRLLSDTILAVLLSEVACVSAFLYVETNLKFLKKGKKIVSFRGLEYQLKVLVKKVKKIREKMEVDLGLSFRR